MAGVLVVVALAVIVALVIFYIRRKGSFTLHSRVESKERTNTQLCSLEIENPLYSGELIIS